MRRSPLFTIAGSVLASALLLTACSGGPTAEPAAGETSAATGQKAVTLTVATFNEFGYDDLYAEYMTDNPNVKIEQKKAATSNEARDNMNTRLAAGSGLSDIEAVEVDWLPDLMQSSDMLEDLSNAELKDRWLDWKSAGATTPDGKLIGYGTDIGPEAVCYRADLFKKAGLPSAPAEVATMLGSTWDDYFAAGKDFVAKSDGVAWFDSAGAIWQGRLNQQKNAYSSSDTEETLIPLGENTEIKDIFTSTLKAAVDDKLSAGLAQWSPDWNNGFQNDSFATMLCPSWMLGVIEGNAAGVEGWDIANVFPGGGGNWGGSYLTVPSMGENTAEATKLAAWLTAPEQQLKAFESKGTFPSQIEALGSDALATSTNKFFNDAPVGKIMAERAAAVTVAPYKGPNYFAASTIISDAINRVEVEKVDTIDASWDKAVQEFNSLQ